MGIDEAWHEKLAMTQLRNFRIHATFLSERILYQRAVYVLDNPFNRAGIPYRQEAAGQKLRLGQRLRVDHSAVVDTHVASDQVRDEE